MRENSLPGGESPSSAHRTRWHSHPCPRGRDRQGSNARNDVTFGHLWWANLLKSRDTGDGVGRSIVEKRQKARRMRWSSEGGFVLLAWIQERFAEEFYALLKLGYCFEYCE